MASVMDVTDARMTRTRANPDPVAAAVPDMDPDGDGIPDCDCIYCDDEGVPYCFTTLLVPDDHPTIQDAIDAAPICNATIQIAAGTWQIQETIDTLGKAVKLARNDRTRRRTPDDPRRARFGRRSSAATVARHPGNADQKPDHPETVRQSNGGGIALIESSPTLIGCLLRGNRSSESGGAMYIDVSEPLVIGCTFTGNIAELHGGGAFNYNCDPTFESCTFLDNQARTGGGLHNEQYSFPVIKECRFTGNIVDGLLGGGINSNLSYPLLIDDMLCGNYPVQLSGEWLDGGDNTFMSDCEGDCPADTDGNGTVDGADLNTLLAHWDETGSVGDLNQDQKVDGLDLNILLGAWGPCQ